MSRLQKTGIELDGYLELSPAEEEIDIASTNYPERKWFLAAIIHVAVIRLVIVIDEK